MLALSSLTVRTYSNFIRSVTSLLRRVSVCVRIGHSQIGSHNGAITYLIGNCLSCIEESELEASKDFLINCPDFARSKLKNLGVHTFGEPGKVAGMYISRLNNFAYQRSQLFKVRSCVTFDARFSSTTSLILYGDIFVHKYLLIVIKVVRNSGSTVFKIRQLIFILCARIKRSRLLF